MRRAKTLRVWLALGLAVSQVLTASAHAELVSSSPAADERLASAPAAITLSFDDELDGANSRCELLDARGQPVAGAAGALDLTDPDHKRLVIQPLPALPDGVYTVHWTAVSTDGDGEATEGDYNFVIGQAALPAPAAGAGEAAPTASLTPAPAAAPAAPSLAVPLGIVAVVLIVLAGMGVALRRGGKPTE